MLFRSGGNPTKRQLEGMLSATPKATQHLCFDNDEAGRAFASNYAYQQTPEWRGYVASMTDPQKRQSGDADLLPKTILPVYAKAENAEIEYYAARSSGLICKEELEELKKEALEAKDVLRQKLEEALPMRERVTFEKPPEGYKDWNEALLSQIQKTEEKELDDKLDEHRTSAFHR